MYKQALAYMHKKAEDEDLDAEWARREQQEAEKRKAQDMFNMQRHHFVGLIPYGMQEKEKLYDALGDKHYRDILPQNILKSDIDKLDDQWNKPYSDDEMEAIREKQADAYVKELFPTDDLKQRSAKPWLMDYGRTRYNYRKAHMYDNDGVGRSPEDGAPGLELPKFKYKDKFTPKEQKQLDVLAPLMTKNKTKNPTITG